MFSLLISEAKMIKSKIASLFPENPRRKIEDNNIVLETMKEQERPDLTPLQPQSFGASISGSGTETLIQQLESEAATDTTITGPNNTERRKSFERSDSDKTLSPEPWVLAGDPTTRPKLFHLDSDTIRDESSLENLDNEIWQNPDLMAIKKFQDVIESFVRSVLESMKKRNPALQFNLIHCGSYYEGLRVGLPYEFDYMLELINFKAVQVIPNYTNCGQKLEHMEVKFVTTQARAQGDAPNTLYAKSQMQFVQFKKSLVPIFRECVRKHESHQGIKVMEVSDHYNSPNFKLFLKYLGKGVMVDLVPCVKFPIICSDILPKYSDDTVDLVMQIVPECPKMKQAATKFITQQLYMVCTDLDSKWRISTSILEHIMVKNLPHEIKRSLRIIKYLCNMHFIYQDPYDTKYLAQENSLKLFGYKPFIPSYALKQLFLHKLVDLRYKLSDCSTEQNIVNSMLNYLKDFQNCTRKSFDNSKVEIISFLFGDKHLHKFIFGQDLALLKTKREPTKWYKQMLGLIEGIVRSDGNASDKCNHKLLNYPVQDGVKFYQRAPMYAE